MTGLSAVARWSTRGNHAYRRAPHVYRATMKPSRKSDQQHLSLIELGPVRVRALAVGAQALGALALGTLAIGAIAISRVFVSRARIRKLHIDELTVGRLRIHERIDVPDPVPPTGN